ncbi:MAG: UvrD-helicase domain-containing protein, partial [Acidobacteriota bacterium]
CFLAFNVHISKELNKRLDGAMECRTIHSIGRQTIADHLSKQIAVEKTGGAKYKAIIKPLARGLAEDLFRELAKGSGEDAPTEHDVSSSLYDLTSFCQATLTSPDDRAELQAMIDHFGIDLPCSLDLLAPMVRRILDEGIKQAEREKLISFSDMIWLPHLLKLQPSQYDWLFVDECQDLNKAQLELVMKMRARGGRMLFVGDPSQSIYGFSGADCESFWKIKERTGAVELPLSVCYRCPSSVIERAKEIVPAIEPCENAPAGKVAEINESALSKTIREGDLILCRLTAPLISQCLALIAQRIPARVKGTDIGKSLASLAQKVAEHKEFSFDRFAHFLELYVRRQIERLSRREGSEAQIEAILDKKECLLICLTAFDVQCVDELCNEINTLFSEDRAGVTLSTVHKAKGLEEERVFIIKPEKLPLVWKGQQAWERAQEQNIKYVALTRAKSELYFVVADSSTVTQPQVVQPVLPSLIQQAQLLPFSEPLQTVQESPAQRLGQIADNISALFTECESLIGKGIAVPWAYADWRDSFGAALQKLSGIVQHNAQRDAQRASNGE